MLEWLRRATDGRGGRARPARGGTAPDVTAPDGTGAGAGASSDGEPGGIVLYTRERCHLCAEAEHLLRALCARRGVDLTCVDVDALDPAARARYTDLVPVVEVGGEEVARWRVDVGRVERALDALGGADVRSAPGEP